MKDEKILEQKDSEPRMEERKVTISVTLGNGFVATDPDDFDRQKISYPQNSHS